MSKTRKDGVLSSICRVERTIAENAHVVILLLDTPGIYPELAVCLKGIP
jgi:hypothetical protein